MNGMLPRACYFDIDGTIVDSSGAIHPKVLESIDWLHVRNIGVGVATGRPWFAAKPIAEKIRATVPCLSYSGALLTSPENWKEIHSQALEINQIRAILTCCAEFDWYVELYDSDAYYVKALNHISTIHKEYLHKLPQILDFKDSNQIKGPFLKAVIVFERSPSPECISEILRRVPDIEIGIGHGAAHPHIHFLNLTHANTGRAHGLNYICDALSCTPKELMAFGDGASDIHFLSTVKWGIAMDNAADEVKSTASYTAPSVEDQGVYQFLSNFLSTVSNENTP